MPASMCNLACHLQKHEALKHHRFYNMGACCGPIPVRADYSEVLSWCLFCVVSTPSGSMKDIACLKL